MGKLIGKLKLLLKQLKGRTKQLLTLNPGIGWLVGFGLTSHSAI